MLTSWKANELGYAGVNKDTNYDYVDPMVKHPMKGLFSVVSKVLRNSMYTKAKIELELLPLMFISLILLFSLSMVRLFKGGCLNK
jgi:hypothetical protein